MSVHVIGAVLRIVFEHEDRRVVPVRAVREGFYHAAQSEVVIGYRRSRRRRSGTCAGCVVIGQPQQHELWQLLASATFARLHKPGEFTQKFIGAKLLGIFNSEVGVVRVEVSTQLWLGRRVIRNQGNRELVGALATTQLLRKIFPGLDFLARAIRRMVLGCAGGRRAVLLHVFAPPGVHELAVVAVGQVVPGQVPPEIAGRRIIYVGNAEVHRDNVTHGPLEVVTALLAAIDDLPGFLVVVAGDGRGGPYVSVAGNFTAVVEVVENAKLPRQLMLVGRDVLAVHHQRRIAVRLANVAEDLIVSTVLLDHVDHVTNGILHPNACKTSTRWGPRIAAALEADLAGAALHLIAADNFLR